MRVAFTDFWVGFDPSRSAIIQALLRGHDLEIAPRDQADLLVFSVFGSEHAAFVGPKLHLTGENVRPRWDAADFCLGFDHIEHPRYLRLPLPVHCALDDRMHGRSELSGPAWHEREFCNFIYHQPGTPERRALFESIARYRPVTSPGRFLNNTQAPELSARYDLDWRSSKLDYQRRFRFTIAAENEAFPGYTTEKLWDALVAGTIPIYWGNPRVAEDVDPRAFIDCAAFPDFDAVAAHVRRVDEDPRLAAAYLEHRPWLVTPLERYEQAFHDFVERLIEFARERPRARFALRAARLRGRELAARLRRPKRLIRSLVGRTRARPATRR
jgi:hypothetical protein